MNKAVAHTTSHVGNINIMRPYGHKHAGHENRQWTSDDDASLSEARAAFEQARKDGYLMCEINRNGSNAEHEVVREFNPNADEIVGIPPMQGG